MVFLLFLKTYRMDGRGHVDMKPDSGVIEAKVGTDEESGTGGCGVAPIGHRIFHVCHGWREFVKVQLEEKITWTCPIFNEHSMYAPPGSTPRGTRDRRMTGRPQRRNLPTPNGRTSDLSAKFKRNKPKTSDERLHKICWQMLVWLWSLGVGHVGGMVTTGSHALCPGQSAHVHDYVGLEVPPGVGHSVREHQAALGVGVVYLHGFVECHIKLRGDTHMTSALGPPEADKSRWGEKQMGGGVRPMRTSILLKSKLEQ